MYRIFAVRRKYKVRSQNIIIITIINIMFFFDVHTFMGEVKVLGVVLTLTYGLMQKPDVTYV